MDHVRVASEFLNFSPKRFALLFKVVKKALPEVCHHHLIDVCRTRWVARLDGLDIFIDLLPAVVRCFEEIRDNPDGNWNREST